MPFSRVLYFAKYKRNVNRVTFRANEHEQKPSGGTLSLPVIPSQRSIMSNAKATRCPSTGRSGDHFSSRRTSILPSQEGYRKFRFGELSSPRRRHFEPAQSRKICNWASLKY